MTLKKRLEALERQQPPEGGIREILIMGTDDNGEQYPIERWYPGSNRPDEYYDRATGQWQIEKPGRK